MKRKGIQVSKRFLLLLLVPILFIGSQAASVEQSESSQTMAHPSELYFSSIPANPNVYRKISVFSDPQLKKEKGQKDELDNMILQDFYKHNQNKVLRQENEIIRLRAQLNSYSNYDSLGLKITPEIKILFPKVETIGLSKMIRNRIATSQSDTLTVAILSYTQRLTPEEKQQLHAWLTTRLNVGKLEIVTENQ